MKDSLESFRFVFADSSTINKNASNIENAAILAVAQRISQGQPHNIIGAFAKNNGKFEMVKLTQINISLVPKVGF